MKLTNLWLVLGVIALMIIPLCLPRPADQESFTGADAQAESAISQINPEYKPWAAPIFEPPSGEIETMIFALQAALGSGLVCYYFGLMRGRKQQSTASEKDCATHTG